MEYIQTTNAPAAIGPYSQAIVSGELVYTSGQIALKPDGTLVENDVKKQTRQVFENLRHVLEAAGSSVEQVIKVNIFLDNMDDFGLVNVLFAEFFGDHKPARSTVAVQTLPKRVLIEIDVVAKATNF
ncbi:MAG: Rid family detoxifying hydrolase [Campylobacterota bacterium]|nr:Rid family detoxifying hydrolase [Campylobacterota bacterium]